MGSTSLIGRAPSELQSDGALPTGGEQNENVHAYLVAQIQEDGGIGSPWVENAGDRFATAQGYLALEGKSYLTLLGK